jgi:hypothetical protein
MIRADTLIEKLALTTEGQMKRGFDRALGPPQRLKIP